MTSTTHKTIFMAVISLSLALNACADSRKPDAAGDSPAGQGRTASVSGGPSGRPAAAEAAGLQAVVPAPTEQTGANGRLTEDERNTIEVVRKTKNSVV